MNSMMGAGMIYGLSSTDMTEHKIKKYNPTYLKRSKAHVYTIW